MTISWLLWRIWGVFWLCAQCCALGAVAHAQDAGALNQARLYGSLEMAPEHAAEGRKAGWRVAMISAKWDRFEPRAGVFDEKYASELKEQKAALRKLGYLLQLDFGVQYPPAWVGELPNGRYKNQFGDMFTTGQSGENLPNVVFNAAVRSRLAEYFGKVFELVGSDWDFVRLGCAKFGELNFPQPVFGGHQNCYWAFDDLAQGKAEGLAGGLNVCPVPGWIPGQTSQGHESAYKFADWYLDCLRNYQEWQITTVRQCYKGDICMLYGSWGIRPGWLDGAVAGDLNGKTSCERNGEIQQGFDWARVIGSIRDPHVIVYCTWMDGTIDNRDISDDNSADATRWSPVHWQASLAQKNPLQLRVWGENTGRNNRDAMRLTFERIKQYNLMGVMWAFDAELFANPNPRKFATFRDYSEFIKSN